MHWNIPTQVEAVTVGGTFYVNACLADSSSHTETMKKVTCKKCKALIERPSTPMTVAAKLIALVIEEQEKGRKLDFSIEVKCNSCENDVDVWGWYESVEMHVCMQKMVHFLDHVAYAHGLGSEVLFVRHYTPMSVYELNYGMGKASGTEHEKRWRAMNDFADHQDVLR
jgi:hypothetical protein